MGAGSACYPMTAAIMVPIVAVRWRNLIKVDFVVPPNLSVPSSLSDLLIRVFKHGESVNAKICGQSIGQVLFELLRSGILVLYDHRCDGRSTRLDISIDAQGN